jgi:hypothetical protein
MIDQFEVELSGDLKVSEAEVMPEVRQTVVRSTNYLQQGDTFAFGVRVSHGKVEGNIDNLVKSIGVALKCKSLKTDKVLSFPPGRAREVSGKACEGGDDLEARYFTVGTWLYQAMALFTFSDSNAAAARHFVESLKVLRTK